MTKSKLKELMNRYLILSWDEACGAIEFVSDLLDDIADETEEKEPYAINSISRMRSAANEVYNLLNIDFEE